MESLNLDLYVYCYQCDNSLEIKRQYVDKGQVIVEVEPCSDCMEIQYNAGNSDGYAEAVLKYDTE